MMFTLTKEHNGELVHLRVGDELEVHLEGNLTTGYTWEVQQVDPTLIKQTAGPIYHAEGNALGAPGRVVYRFESTAPGQTELSFAYRRSWESDQPPLDTYQVMLAAEEPGT